MHHRHQAGPTRRSMLNNAPIFLNGFTRGGSNIVTNLLLSHPGVCLPTGETQKVFLGETGVEPRWRTPYKRWRYDFPLALSGRRDLFNPDDLSERPTLSPWAMRHIDRVLYRERFVARHEMHNRFVSEGVLYTDEVLARARLFCRNLNGVVLMTDNFAAMYPDATFFGLIRNGLSLCEGLMRRGRSVESSAELYCRLADKMLADSERYERYRIARFEDILRDPLKEMAALYQHADLDFGQIEKIRLQTHPTLSRSGEHRLERGKEGQVVWYTRDQVESHFRPDIDAIQQDKLTATDRDSFLKVAGATMEKLGYL